jgi:hypothetical protein
MDQMPEVGIQFRCAREANFLCRGVKIGYYQVDGFTAHHFCSMVRHDMAVTASLVAAVAKIDLQAFQPGALERR